MWGATSLCCGSSVTCADGRGTTQYSSKCGGTLQGSREDDGTYTFAESITTGRATDQSTGCLDSVITCTLKGDGTMLMSCYALWKGKAYKGAGTLKKD